MQRFHIQMKQLSSLPNLDNNPICRRLRDHPSNLQFLRRILQLKLKPIHKYRHKNRKFCPCKTLPNTSAGSMDEGQMRIVANCATAVVVARGFVGGRVNVEPAVRVEQMRVLAPHVFVPADRKSG